MLDVGNAIILSARYGAFAAALDQESETLSLKMQAQFF